MSWSRSAVASITSQPIFQEYTHQTFKNAEFLLSWTQLAGPRQFPLFPPLLSCHFADSVKDGPCPRQIKRQKTKQKNENGPHPLIASSSSRRYLQPKVKSMLQLGVETGEKG